MNARMSEEDRRIIRMQQEVIIILDRHISQLEAKLRERDKIEKEAGSRA